MPAIQDTIMRAVYVKGCRILEDKNALCAILEDLSPDLQREREFIDKVYNNGIGKIFYHACQAESSKKREYLKEADEYLNKENGRNENWRKRLLSYFEDTVMRGDVSPVNFPQSAVQQPTISKLVVSKPMGRVLQKGQRVLFEDSMKMALVGMGWDVSGYSGRYNFDLDVSAFLLEANGKCLRNEDFVFYNNLKGRNGAVVLQGDNLVGGSNGDDEAIIIDFSRIADEIQKIVICVTIYDAAVRCQNFGQVSNAYVRIVKIEDEFDRQGEELFRFNFGEKLFRETALVVCEIYRYKEKWKFNAVDAGIQGGLEELVRSFGLSVK